MKHRDQEKERIRSDRKRLVSYALKFPKSLFVGLLALMVAMVAQLYSPLFIKRIFDIELKKPQSDPEAILSLLAFFLGFKAVEALFQYLSTISLTMTAMKIVQRMRLDLYRNIQRLSISFFDNMPAGSIVSKIVNDTEAVQNLYVKVMGQILISTIYIIGVYIAIFLTDTGFWTAFLLLLPLIYVLIGFYIKKARKYNDIIRSKIGQINAMINESVQGISIIQAFGAQPRLMREFEEINEERSRQRVNMLYLESGGSYNGVNTLKNIAFTIMIYYFGSLVLKIKHPIGVGLLYVYVEYINMVFHHLTRILEQLGEMERAGVAAAHVFEMLDERGKEISRERMERIRGEVVFEKVGFYYQEGEYVLKEIDIYAKSGETVALVGHTGSGKSSLINLLLKFYAPTEGRIFIDGQDIGELPDQALRSHMGIVLQEPFLFSGSILINITLGKEGISREDAIRALEAVGAESVLKNLKEGIDESVREGGATLSSGQRQLISFARALAHDPGILILDEATSSVDSETEQLIQSAMKVLMKGRTSFVIAHRLSTIRNADRIYLLEKGRIAESGTHDELIEKKGRYYEMYRAQSAMLRG